MSGRRLRNAVSYTCHHTAHLTNGQVLQTLLANGYPSNTQVVIAGLANTYPRPSACTYLTAAATPTTLSLTRSTRTSATRAVRLFVR